MSSSTCMSKVKAVIVVDPYSTGRYLLPELQKRSLPIICVRSSLNLAQFWLDQYDASQYVATVDFESVEQVLSVLGDRFEIVSVLIGSEPGVMVAEDLQEALGLPSHEGPKEWRRHKFSQQERVREMGLRAVRQLYSDDVEEMLRWCDSYGEWPVIVKPAMSGGSDGVYWCHKEADVREAVSKELGIMNVNGCVNHKLLVQEYLDGDEYIVDAVSREGRHVLSAIWVYKKKKCEATKSISYEYVRLLESKGEIQDSLVTYVVGVLDAIKFRNGASHTEVMLVKDGPCLVEVNSRMHGLKAPKVIEECTGLGTHELLVDALVGDHRVFDFLADQEDYRYCLKKWGFMTCLINQNTTGVLRESLVDERISSLSSVQSIHAGVQVGEVLGLTRDLGSAPAQIVMEHTSLEHLLADVEQIRALEAAGFYEEKLVSRVAAVSTKPVRGLSENVMEVKMGAGAGALQQATRVALCEADKEN